MPQNRRAFFSDTTNVYLTPSEPAAHEVVTVSFRTERDEGSQVFVVCRGRKLPMHRAEYDENFDYYRCELELAEEKVTYYFEIVTGDEICFYDTRGPVQDVNESCHFVVIPGFQTPDWAKGAVMYQIFTDRFCNGDPSNDVQTGEYYYIDRQVQRIEDWYRYPEKKDVAHFYGGDLQGVLDKLDYLKDLGVEVLYFNPLFVSPSNHKYDTQDYDFIDPHLGKIVSDGDYIHRVTDKKNLEASNQLFIHLVEEAHRRGMRVILDGVFNHCGSFNKWMDREGVYRHAEGYQTGAYVSGDSPYRDYFRFEREDWPENDSYEGWWDHKTLPKLNYDGSQALEAYVLQIARKWVSAPYCADGWRLDVAADLGHSPEYNHAFWQKFRQAVKEANPEALILAEHYGCALDWLQGNEWDTVMNYDAFMEPVTWFLTGMEKHSDGFREDLLGNSEAFWSAMRCHSASFAMPSWQCAMNELSNHDHSRFLTRTNRRVGRIDTLGPEAAQEGINRAVLREAVVIQMTWMGAPTIYYGDEAGLCGFTDPDNRRTYPWGREDQGLIAFHRDIIRLRREHEELRTGSLKYVDSDYNYIAYGRFHKKGQCLILINNNDHPITRTVSVWELGTSRRGNMKVLLQSREKDYVLDGAEIELSEGKIEIELPKTSATVLKYGGRSEDKRRE